MIINQKEDGSGEILFTNKEVEIINKQGKLILTKEFLKDFINLFIGLFMQYQRKFSKDLISRVTPMDKNIGIEENQKDKEN